MIQSPYSINVRDLLAFVTLSLIASPPNYIWQTWLEATFPGYTERLTGFEKEKLVDEVVAGRSTGTQEMEPSNSTIRSRNEKQRAMTTESTSAKPQTASVSGPRLNIRNTAAKFLLDQSFGAAANTVIFIMGIALLQGRGIEQGARECRENFWTLIRAGHKLWPLVSIVSLTMVPVEHRMIFGSIVGVGWGIFLSFFSNKRNSTLKNE